MAVGSGDQKRSSDSGIPVKNGRPAAAGATFMDSGVTFPSRQRARILIG